MLPNAAGKTYNDVLLKSIPFSSVVGMSSTTYRPLRIKAIPSYETPGHVKLPIHGAASQKARIFENLLY